MPEVKERKENLSQTLIAKEAVKPRLIDVDSAKETLVPREIKSWMEKVEEVTTAAPQVNDDTGQPLLSSSPSPSPKVTLPITRATFLVGFQKTVSDAGHWLSRFILRLIKIKKGQVIFKSPQNEP
ncbi:MAG: hypothetical protein UU09_C0008G0006 [Microgenomates group bacterium GW2011_GWA2_40_6]|nr:MAG: hypothetical protein UU09_C0008G0006 [Microgenomates group bacterium GW2011_GWA2_40_6]